MRVDDRLAEKSLSSSKKSKRRRKKSRTMPTVVQRLFDTCKEIFENGGPGFVPCPEDVGRLRSVLDTMKPGDVGLSPKMQFFQNVESEGPSTITSLRLYECAKFSICVFCLPQSAVIPLHNHPDMTVFSKLLFGSMHIKSYDWVNDLPNSNETINPTNDVHLAKVVTDAVLEAPCETSILYPTAGGNMHRFTAVTSCAVLDVLGPPYSIPERDITFYHDFAYSNFSGNAAPVQGEGNSFAWLKEREGKPEESIVVGVEYKGPKIVDR